MKTDSAGKVCPFCIENGMVKLIDETDAAYLVQVIKNVDGQPVTQTGRYFVIPKVHIESILERPDDWTRHEKLMLWRAIIEAEKDANLMIRMGSRDLHDVLNTNWNNGWWAGRRVLHSHMWVIFRYDRFEIGMDTMIDRIVGLTSEIAQLRTARSLDLATCGLPT